MRSVVGLALVTAGIALTLAGCQRAAQAPGPETAGEKTTQVVDIVAREFAFEPKEIRINAGMAKFVVRNAGTVEHDFEIVGAAEHGMEHTAKLIQPNEVYTVQVDLRPGTYQVVCNVAGHKDAGMVGTIVVL